MFWANKWIYITFATLANTSKPNFSCSADYKKYENNRRGARKQNDFTPQIANVHLIFGHVILNVSNIEELWLLMKQANKLKCLIY